MRLTSKEEYLIKNGKKMETIKFCRSLKVPKEHLFWFVDKIEKENCIIESKAFKSNVSLVLKMFEKNKKLKDSTKTLKQAILRAQQFVETNEDESLRILKRFDDGCYIINLSYKELYFEGKSMRNCLPNMLDIVKRKEIAILALKNAKSKTICHIQVGKNGNLEQHYQFANSNVNLNTWKYINEFFCVNKSLEFDKILKEKNIQKLYNIQTIDGECLITSQIPIESKVSFFESKNSKKENFKTIPLKVHNYSNYNVKNRNLTQINYEEALDYLEDYKIEILKKLEEIQKSLQISKENLFILNDNMYQKIFGKNIDAIKRFNNIIESHNEETKTCEAPYRLEENMDLFDNFPEVEEEAIDLQEDVSFEDMF